MKIWSNLNASFNLEKKSLQECQTTKYISCYTNIYCLFNEAAFYPLFICKKQHIKLQSPLFFCHEYLKI